MTARSSPGIGKRSEDRMRTFIRVSAANEPVRLVRCVPAVGSEKLYRQAGRHPAFLPLTFSLGVARAPALPAVYFLRRMARRKSANERAVHKSSGEGVAETAGIAQTPIASCSRPAVGTSAASPCADMVRDLHAAPRASTGHFTPSSWPKPVAKPVDSSLAHSE